MNLRRIFAFVFTFGLLSLVAAPLSSATIDPRNIKEVILVRGSKMTVCPFNQYSSATKARIADENPYYSMEEYLQLHPNLREGDGGCKEFLYGQIELVPFGKEPTFIPTEYIYIFDGTIIREAKILLTRPTQFSDEKEVYKKVLDFKAIDEGSGQEVDLPDTIFWFRGHEVYGRIGNVVEGVVVYKGAYYRHDGAQTLVNHTVLWRNPNSQPVDQRYVIAEVPAVVVPFAAPTPPRDYPSPIPWKISIYGREVEGKIYPTDLPSPLWGANPPNRFVGYWLDLPSVLASTQGLIAAFKTCADEFCAASFDQAVFITDESGRFLDWTYNFNDKVKIVDLNTEYFRTHRKVFLIMGTYKVPPANGIRYKFYYGPLTGYSSFSSSVSPTPSSAPFPSPTPVATPSATPPAPLVSLDIARERLVVLGGSTGDNSQNVDSITNAAEYYNPFQKVWGSFPPMLYPRAGHAAVALGSKIYVFGGAYQAGRGLNKAEFFDDLTGSWKEIPAPPDPRTNIVDMSIFPWGNKIILIYPHSAGGADLTSSVYSFNSETLEYQALKPPGVWLSRCFMQYAKIYCFRRDDLTYVYRYDPLEDTWEKSPIENRQRFEENIYAYDYGAFVLAKDSYGTQRLFRFNTSANRYESLGAVFNPGANKIFNFTLGSLGGDLIIAGGQINYDGRYVAQPDLYVYTHNNATNAILRMEKAMTVGRASAAIVTLPLVGNTPGALISGMVSTGDSRSPLTRVTQVSLYKILSRGSYGVRTYLVASQNLDSSGKFSFPGLDSGEYNLYVGGAYNRFSNLNWQNPLRLDPNQKLEKLEIIAYP